MEQSLIKPTRLKQKIKFYRNRKSRKQTMDPRLQQFIQMETEKAKMQVLPSHHLN